MLISCHWLNQLLALRKTKFGDHLTEMAQLESGEPASVKPLLNRLGTSTSSVEPAKIAEILTSLGLEVEAQHVYGEGVGEVIVGEIKSKDPHPEADRLTVVQLFDGKAEVQVVCGASNLPEVGGKVAFAPVGAVLPGDFKIGARKIRGVESFGMICSETELEIGHDGDGILILPNDFETGARLCEVVPQIRDTVLELGVTPNRPDALGHVGVARDVATKLGCGLNLPPLRALEGREPAVPEVPELVTLQATARDRCGRYIGHALTSVKVKPSPLWMRVQLHRLGLRAINNCVDITNYVLMEQGQPLHVFDRERLHEGRVVVRRAGDNEPMTTLDGTEIKLSSEDLVIADATNPQALAGVMGGSDSMVSDKTTTILLEAAYFTPPRIRASARRHGFHTDSSYRFERGVDHGRGLSRASTRALNLLEELAEATCIGVAEVTGERPPAAQIKLRNSRVRRILGVDVPAQVAKATLTGLEVEVDDSDPEAWQCVAPTHRPDLQREDDLVEEVMRFYGLDNIEAKSTVPSEPVPEVRDPMQVRIERVVDGLREVGLHEIVSMAFTAREKLEPFAEVTPLERIVEVANPMRVQAGYMRTHLLPGLLDALEVNVAHHARPIALFEVGRVYAWPKEQVDCGGPTAEVDRLLPCESPRAGVLLCGGRGQVEGLNAPAAGGAIVHTLARLGLAAEIRAVTQPTSFLHPGVQGTVFASAPGQEPCAVGIVGEIHPDLLGGRELPEGMRAYYAELRIDEVPAVGAAQAEGLPRFPATSRDLSLEVPVSFPAADVVAALQAAAAQTLAAGKDQDIEIAGDHFGVSREPVEVVEDYRGKGVPEGWRALLLRMSYRAKERSVTDAEVQQLHQQIVEAACEALRPQIPEIRVR